MALWTGFRLGLGFATGLTQDRFLLLSVLLLVGPKLEEIIELLAINPVHQLFRCLWMDGLLGNQPIGVASVVDIWCEKWI